jgi:hypothetical protein
VLLDEHFDEHFDDDSHNLDFDEHNLDFDEHNLDDAFVHTEWQLLQQHRWDSVL